MKKEEVFDQLATKGLQYLENFEQFAKTEIPDYLQQIIKYHFIESLMAVVAAIFGLCIAVFLLRKMVKFDRDNHEKNFIKVPALFVSIAFISMFSLIGLTSHFPIVLKTTIAPKVFLVDYFRGKE